MSIELEAEIDRNLFSFLPRLPGLLENFRGQFAVLKNQEIVGIHRKLSDALQAGEELCLDGIYSIQEVTDRPVELGFFSYAHHNG